MIANNIKRKIEATIKAEMLQDKIDEDEMRIQNLKDQIRNLEEVNDMRRQQIDELKPSIMTTREYIKMLEIEGK